MNYNVLFLALDHFLPVVVNGRGWSPIQLAPPRWSSHQLISAFRGLVTCSRVPWQCTAPTTFHVMSASGVDPRTLCSSAHPPTEGASSPQHWYEMMPPERHQMGDPATPNSRKSTTDPSPHRQHMVKSVKGKITAEALRPSLLWVALTPLH